MADLSNQQIQVIELKMMDKRKYYPLTVLSGFSIRCLLYPFTLIKTRLQVQKGRSIYNGTFDAFRKILQAEGAPGLYRGFMVNSIQVIPQLFYISTYEGTRQYLKHNTPITNNKIRSFIAGGSASIVGQTLLVPVDIVSQHIMMIGENQAPAKKGKIHVRSLAPLNIPTGPGMSRYGMTKAVTQAVYRRDGLLGFYKGYLASLAVYAPNSAMWWFFYDTYCGMLQDVAPVWVPRLVLQCVAAPLGGCTTSFISNPLDVIRARIQLENTKFVETTRQLWMEERLWMFTKGLTARLVQSITFSFCIILGYETIKRFSLLEEYKSGVRW